MTYEMRLDALTKSIMVCREMAQVGDIDALKAMPRLMAEYTNTIKTPTNDRYANMTDKQLMDAVENVLNDRAT